MFPLNWRIEDPNLFLYSLERLSQKSTGSVSLKPSTTVIEEIKTKRTAGDSETDLKEDQSRQDETPSSASNGLKVFSSF